MNLPTNQELLRIYAVAISPDSLPKPSHQGLSGCDLFWLPYEDFSLAVSNTNCADSTSMESILEYEAVVQMLHDNFEIVPMRFGTVMQAMQIPRLIHDRQKALRDTLERVAGCSELLLRWSVGESEQIDSIDDNKPSDMNSKRTTGSDYLKKKYFESVRHQKYDTFALEAKAKVQSILGNSVQGVLSNIVDLNESLPVMSTLENKPVVAVDLLVKNVRFKEVFEIAKAIHLFGKPPVIARGPLPIYSFS